MAWWLLPTFDPARRKRNNPYFSLRRRVRRPTQGNARVVMTYTLAFRWAHLAFIIADNFFRMAALIGLRPACFFGAALAFFGADSPFCLAHRARCAAAILARADALIVRRFRPLAFRPLFTLRGRPRRACWEPSPIRASIACSIRLAS